MAHVELMVADVDSPNLREACYQHRVTMVPNREKEDSVHFVGTRADLEALIDSEFDSGDEADVAHLKGCIE